MEKIKINCYKITSVFPLDRIAKYFKMHRLLSWRDYIILDGYHLEMVLKQSAGSKQVYLFKFGCISFVNFDENDVFIFLEYMESLIGKIDYHLFSRYNERHSFEIDENNRCRLWKNNSGVVDYYHYYAHIAAVILAKSTELYRMEVELGNLLDDAESFIGYLQKGRLHTNTRNFAAINSRILRFEYESAGSLRIFERSFYEDRGMHSRLVYDDLSEYFELKDRYEIIESKINDLRRIVKSYSTLSYKQNQTRLYWLEVFLLSFFPVYHIIHYLMDVYGIDHVFNIFAN